MKKLLLVAAILTCSAIAQADLLIAFKSTNVTATIAPDAIGANLTSIDLTRGSGISSNAGSTFNSASWTAPTGSTIADAITSNDYISWGFTVDSGFQVSITNLDIRYDISGTGPSNISIRTSLDGFTTDIFTDTSVNNAGENNTIPLSLTGSGAITFRLYGYSASAGTGTMDLEENAAFNNRTIEVEGFVTAIPEPTTLALIGAGFALAYASWRRKKS